MNRIYLRLLITGCLLLLTACSVVDLAYKNAPTLVEGRVDDAFDLSKAQRSQLDARLQSFFDWHRGQELPRYRQLLETAADNAADGITADEFLAFNRDFRQSWRRLQEKAIDSFADLAQTLSPAQIENYRRYYAEKSEERQEYLDMPLAERSKFRVKREIDRLEDWFGNFDRKLEKRVSARLQDLPDIRKSWLEYRENRHLAFVDALSRAPQSSVGNRELQQILLGQSTDYARALEPVRQAYWQAYAAALEDISSWLTDNHRQKAVAKLRKYARAVVRLQNPG